jgi:uncharacterized protein (DUF952 family)
VSVVSDITSVQDAADDARAGVYTPRAFDAEGFIHCSYPRQIQAVANRLFSGRPDLVLLEIDCARLAVPVVDENLEGGTDLFPHIYGALPMAAVVRVHPFPGDAGGRFDLPPTVA